MHVFLFHLHIVVCFYTHKVVVYSCCIALKVNAATQPSGKGLTCIPTSHIHEEGLLQCVMCFDLSEPLQAFLKY